MKIFYLSIFTLFLIKSATYQSKAHILKVCASCNYTTITGAVRDAKAGDSVIVEKGNYFERDITITKPIFLIGIGYPVIDGESGGEIITVESDSVTIAGFQIQNVGTSYIKDQAGIQVKGKYCQVLDNVLLNTFFGIYLQKAHFTLIQNNRITGKAINQISSGNAIHVWDSKNIKVLNNEVRNHRDGIYLEFVDESLIENNISEYNLRYGLHFMFSNDDDYLNNVFRDNGAGVAVMFSRNIQMIGNTFDHNWGSSSYGLLLKEIYDGKIEKNTFSQNTIGIYGESANRIIIERNTFMNNGWALKILGSCMDNVISGNNFSGNTFNLSTNARKNYNIYDGNYWSDYTGYDLNRDGIGDVPYRPVKLYAYLVETVPTSILLLRSMFTEFLNFAEKVNPTFTPEGLIDQSPQMKKFDL